MKSNKIGVCSLISDSLLPGKIDMICQCKQTKRHLVIDFKTGSRLPTRAAIERFESLQLGFYCQATQQNIGPILGAAYIHINKQDVSLELAMIEADLKEHPFLDIKRRSFPRSTLYIEKLNQEIQSLVNAIQKGHFVDKEDSPPSYRDFCDYASRYAYQN